MCSQGRPRTSREQRVRAALCVLRPERARSNKWDLLQVQRAGRGGEECRDRFTPVPTAALDNTHSLQKRPLVPTCLEAIRVSFEAGIFKWTRGQAPPAPTFPVAVLKCCPGSSLAAGGCGGGEGGPLPTHPLPLHFLCQANLIIDF